MVDRVSESSDEQFNICTRVQQSGVLFKRPFGHQSNKWSKRFFVVKDCFLLYYPENEKKIFDRRGCFNIHPKGVIPLGGCTVESCTDQGQQFSIHIRSDEFNTDFVAVAAENQQDRDRWLQVLQQAGRITWQNTQLGETLIRELETQGLQLTREKQDCLERLQEETSALREEIDRNEELSKVTQELDKERKKLEGMISELKEQQEMFRRDYDETVVAMKTVDGDKDQLNETIAALQMSLKNLAEERKRTVDALQEQLEENNKLSQTTEELQADLRDIEEETSLILKEKSEFEKRFLQNDFRARVLSEEKDMIFEQVSSLKATLQDLLAQKESTDSELKVEVVARIDAERRLRAAETSLRHLESALHSSTSNLDGDLRDQIMPNVKTLKQFFESVAAEAKVDADKPVIMKNAVLARKLLVQKIKTQKFEQSRKEKARSLGIILPDSPTSSGSLRRSLSTIMNNRSGTGGGMLPLSLRRTTSTRLARIRPMVKQSHSAPATPSTENGVCVVQINLDEPENNNEKEDVPEIRNTASIKMKPHELYNNASTKTYELHNGTQQIQHEMCNGNSKTQHELYNSALSKMKPQELYKGARTKIIINSTDYCAKAQQADVDCDIVEVTNPTIVSSSSSPTRRLAAGTILINGEEVSPRITKMLITQRH